jgi:hypothetical protein
LAELLELHRRQFQLNREAFTRWLMANQRPLGLTQEERL